MDLGKRLKEARERADLSQEALARRADVSTVAVSQIEQGRTKEPHYLTLHRLGKVMGVSPHWLYTGEEPEETTTPGKAEAPSPPDAAATEAGRTVADAVRSLMRRVTADYERELKDPDNPDFKTASAAARWATRVRWEAKRYADWFIEEGSVLMARHAEASSPVFDTKVWVDVFKIALPVYTLNELARRAEKRIEAMNDVPDELDQRRLEKARRETEESVRRIEKLRAASG